jgi:signal transduction histidine kinase/ActR/RegA family two-component response regulator
VRGSWIECLQRLAAGELDLMPDVAYTPERGELYAFNAESVLSNWSQVYARPGSQFHSLLDLGGARVALLEGSVQHRAFLKLTGTFGLTCETVLAPDYASAFQLVADGAADAVVTNRFYGDAHHRHFGLVDVGIVFQPTSLHFAAPKGSEALLATLDQHLRQLKSDPSSAYHQTLARWLGEPPQVLVPTYVWHAALIVLALLLTATILAALFRRQVRIRTAEVIAQVEERRALEEQLRQAHKLEAIGRLAGGVAHDFNNLLVVIMGYTDVLLGELEAKAPQREPMLRVKAAAERAAELTQQLLAVGRKQVVSPQVTNLNGVVEDTTRMLERVVGEDVILAVELQPGLEPVFVDPGQMVQILMNLVVNARDSMPQGGQLTIATSNVVVDDGAVALRPGLQAGHYVRLAVSDTGCGMDEETIARIFEPFFTTKPEGKGTGLGLSTVYGVVKQNRGHIDVDSKTGEGTTFEVLLPAVGERGEPEQREAPRAPGGAATILVVEDEGAVRRLVQTLASSLGYTVLVAASGDEALQVAREHRGPIDLLLTDLVMPKMSGKELAGRMRRERKGLRVLFMSGYSDEALVDRDALTQTGPFLQKPFSSDRLAAELRRCLEGEAR